MIGRKPRGNRTRGISSPFGRTQPSSTPPIRSGRPATGRRPSAQPPRPAGPGRGPAGGPPSLPPPAAAGVALRVGAGATATTASASAKTNPKDLAIAKAAILQMADVPPGFTQVPTKVSKSKPSGVKACKATDAIDKLVTAKAKSEFT